MKQTCDCITWPELLPFVAIAAAICIVTTLLTFTILRNRAQREGGV